MLWTSGEKCTHLSFPLRQILSCIQEALGCAARGVSWAAVASSSQATWAGCRLHHERIAVIHSTEIRALNLALLRSPSALSWGRTPSSLHHKGQGACLGDGCIRDVQSLRMKMSFELVEMCHQLPTLCLLAVTLWSWEILFLQCTPPVDAPLHPWLHW